MDRYVTGAAIKQLREGRRLTQLDLAQKIDVSDKTISKWETGKGYPDITLLEPLAQALGVSVAELLSGNTVSNSNVCANMTRGDFYVCPVCGNVVHSVGEALVSCHGVELQPLEAEEPDKEHAISLEQVEDELLVTVEHPMTKTHNISFIAAVGPDRVQIVKLYPEGPAQVRFRISGVQRVYCYCNKDGLFWVKRTIKR